MSMGLTTDEEFELELNKLNGNKAEIITIPSKGRALGDNNVPESLRKIIGENAIEEGNQVTKELSRSFNVSDSSVSAYKNGATSTDSYNSPNQSLKSHTDKTRERISSLANNRLVKAIKAITDDKLGETKPRDLAGIAKDMSVIVKNMEPERSIDERPSVFILHAPQFRKEESFDTIVINE